jgi:hypothetical protein
MIFLAHSPSQAIPSILQIPNLLDSRQATFRRDRPETCKQRTASRTSVTNRWALDPREQRVEAARLES